MPVQLKPDVMQHLSVQTPDSLVRERQSACIQSACLCWGESPTAYLGLQVCNKLLLLLREGAQGINC